MSIKCRYKYIGHLPFQVESRLINEMGFRIFGRRNGEWTIIEKVAPEPAEGGLTAQEEHKLITKCNALLDYHHSNPQVAKQKLHNLAQLSPLAEGKFIREWVKRNIEKVA